MGMAADSSGQVVVAYLGAGEGAGKITRVNRRAAYSTPSRQWWHS